MGDSNHFFIATFYLDKVSIISKMRAKNFANVL